MEEDEDEANDPAPNTNASSPRYRRVVCSDAVIFERRPREPCVVKTRDALLFGEDDAPLHLPRSTTIPCRHDGHPFSGEPVLIPLSECHHLLGTSGAGPRQRAPMRAANVCCSDECAARWIIDHKVDVQHRLALLGEEARRRGRLEPICPADSVDVLREYGGTKSIDEFRESFGKVHYDVEPPFTRYWMVHVEEQHGDGDVDSTTDFTLHRHEPIVEERTWDVYNLRLPTVEEQRRAAAESRVGERCAQLPSLFDMFAREQLAAPDGEEVNRNAQDAEMEPASPAPRLVGSDRQARITAILARMSQPQAPDGPSRTGGSKRKRTPVTSPTIERRPQQSSLSEFFG